MVRPLLITDVMSSNCWIFVSCGRHFQLVSLSFNISSISWSIGFLTSSNRSQSTMKSLIFSFSLLHSKQSIFDSFLNIFIWLLWSMYEPPQLAHYVFTTLQFGCCLVRSLSCVKITLPQRILDT
jgi:hypothetical protein